MKTSNKILLGTFIFILLVTLGTMIYAKNNMIITEHEDKVGSGNIIEQELAAEYVATELRLDGSYKYTLDPNATNILIRTDKNLVNHFRMSDSDRLSFYREGTLHIQPSEKIEFIIGVASKPELSITAKDRAVVSNRGELNQELNIKAVDRSNTGSFRSWNAIWIGSLPAPQQCRWTSG